MLCYATAKLLRDEAESMVPSIDPEQVRKLAGWGLTQNDIASFVGWCPQPSAVGPVPHQTGFLIRGKEPKTLSKRAHNPLYEKRGCADKADRRPPLRVPGGWEGDWYVWHRLDGLRAIVATALGCMQLGTEKLGEIEASYAPTM